MVLEHPLVAVDDGSNPTTSFGILESFSDSDWSGDKRHRRSTSAGMHLLCSAYMFGSSRTQRVISLSSVRVNSMEWVSTLADGLFLRRCAEFITRPPLNTTC